MKCNLNCSSSLKLGTSSTAKAQARSVDIENNIPAPEILANHPAPSSLANMLARWKACQEYQRYVFLCSCFFVLLSIPVLYWSFRRISWWTKPLTYQYFTEHSHGDDNGRARAMAFFYPLIMGTPAIAFSAVGIELVDTVFNLARRPKRQFFSVCLMLAISVSALVGPFVMQVYVL